MKKIWNNWKKIVDEHNSHITYVDYDNSWSYDMVFYPILLGIIWGLIAGLYTLSIKVLLYFFFGISIIGFLFLILLPIVLEKKNKKL